MTSPLNFNRLTPTDSGRDAHVAAHRLFHELQRHLADLYRRVVHVASAVHEIRRCLSRMRAIVCKNPLALAASDITAIESEIQSAAHFIGLAGVATQGVSAKASMSRHIIGHGLDLAKTWPQPSLN